MADEFEPYGAEWEKQIRLLPKEQIIQLLRTKGREADQLPQDPSNLRQQLRHLMFAYLVGGRKNPERTLAKIAALLLNFPPDRS